MASDPSLNFDERFSELMNALQVAALLAGKRATDARLAATDSDQLYRSITDAIEAAKDLRPTNGTEGA